MKLKLFVAILAVFAGFAAIAAPQYEFNPGERGVSNGSLNILEDVASITLKTDFGSVGNSGAVGYYVYTDDPSKAVQGAVTFTKKDGAITLPELRAGDKVGFFLVRETGTVLRRFNFVSSGDSYFLAFRKGKNNGKSERMLLGSISVEKKTPNGPTGQPLPGVLATLGAGLAMLGIYRKTRRKKNASK